MPTPRSAAEVAWQGATASVLLNLVGMPLDLIRGRSVSGMPIWPPLVSMGVGGLLLMVLRVFRRTPNVHAASLVFVLNNVVIALALYVTSGYYAADPAPWMPFEANKLSVLAVAFLAPSEIYVGVVTILVFTVTPLVKFWLFDAAIRARLPAGEPLPMIAFATFALCLLAYRLRRNALELALLRAQAESVALEANARRLLAVRDMANTPLQTLEINAALLADVPEARPFSDRILRSLSRLREWHRLLEEESTQGAWTPEQEAFDPRKVIEARPTRLRPHTRPPSARSTDHSTGHRRSPP